MAIADSYDGFLLDLDGVVWLGHEFLPGAADAINGLISAAKPVAFITRPITAPRMEAINTMGRMACQPSQAPSAASGASAAHRV